MRGADAVFQWLQGLAAAPALFFLAVVAATLLLEDATALAVGALCAAMRVDPVLGLAALMFGTVLGDLMLHAAGRTWRCHPLVARKLSANPRVAALARSGWTVAAARVVPGLRLPAYLGSGVAGMPLSRFLLLVTITGALWTPLLFLAGGALGSAGAWVGLATLALLMLAMPRLVRVRAAAAPMAG